MEVALLSQLELKTPSDHCYEGSRGWGGGGGGGGGGATCLGQSSSLSRPLLVGE